MGIPLAYSWSVLYVNIKHLLKFIIIINSLTESLKCEWLLSLWRLWGLWFQLVRYCYAVGISFLWGVLLLLLYYYVKLYEDKISRGSSVVREIERSIIFRGGSLEGSAGVREIYRLTIWSKVNITPHNSFSLKSDTTFTSHVNNRPTLSTETPVVSDTSDIQWDLKMAELYLPNGSVALAWMSV